MRTKTLLIAAAALVAGVISSEAQVYSANVVGYINLSLTNGFNLVANQLDSDGTGTNNTISGVFGSSLPPGSTVYEFAGGGWTIVSSYTVNRSGTATNWDAFATNSFNPGQGAFVKVPSSTTVTLVGNVLQGNLVNPNLPGAGGYTLVSSQVPLAGDILTNLVYQAQPGEVIYGYDSAGTAPGASGPGWNYVYTYSANRSGTATNWSPSSPSFAVGQGFFLNAKPNSTWTNNFTVQ
jgi:hypothetical protein